jgi:putative Holliday junction resolvase
MKYIGLDLGSRTLGIAISDELGMLARAVETYRFDEDDYDGMASSVEESTTPTLNQFIETLPLEERVEFNKLLLDGTISMKCS